MTIGRVRVDLESCSRRATVEHGSVVAAVAAGLAALWVTLTLVTALLAAPVDTLTALERKGVWGLPDIVRYGATVLAGAAGVEGPRGRR